MKKNFRIDKKGATLLIAIVIMLVVIVLSMALILLSKSLFTTINRQRQQEQAKEITASISNALEVELISVEASYQKGMSELDKIAVNNKFWTFLRCNLNQTKWPFYDSDVRGHEYSRAVKEFSMEFDSADEKINNYLDNTTITIYYTEPENDFDDLDDEESNQSIQKKIDVFVTVTSNINGEKDSIVRKYELSIANVSVEPEDKVELSETLKSYAISNNNLINPNEVWTFTLEEEGDRNGN